MAVTEQRAIADYNAYSGVVGPIHGYNPDNGQYEIYHGTDLTIIISLENDPETDTPAGTLTQSLTEIEETGQFPFGFDGDDIAASLADQDDGTKVYRIVRSADGNIRIWLDLTYRKTRESRL